MTAGSPNPLDKVRLAFAWVALVIWASSWALDAAAQVWNFDYDTPSSVPAIALGASVLLFGAKVWTRRNDDDG